MIRVLKRRLMSVNGKRHRIKIWGGKLCHAGKRTARLEGEKGQRGRNTFNTRGRSKKVLRPRKNLPFSRTVNYRESQS